MISLESPRFDREDIKIKIGWLNDKDHMRYSEQRHKQHTLDSQWEYVKSFIDEPSNILRDIRLEGNLIGTISAYIDVPNRVADVGLLIGRGFGGKGYGYEAWAMCCNMLFENMNMRRIEGGCMGINLPMIKIFRRFGMKEEGRRMSHFIVDGTYSDLILFGRFR